MLKEMGASDVKIEETAIQSEFGESIKFDKILNLIGNSVLVDTISLVRTHGRVLQAGWLGGLAPVQDFNPMVEMHSGVHFSLFHSKVLGTPDFPMSAVPLQQIVGRFKADNGTQSRLMSSTTTTYKKHTGYWTLTMPEARSS